tara:strand:+ start:435 stop:539 length:105 start_codon:yes stop_codon:yes gene_type:complete
MTLARLDAEMTCDELMLHAARDVLRAEEAKKDGR